MRARSRHNQLRDFHSVDSAPAPCPHNGVALGDAPAGPSPAAELWPSPRHPSNDPDLLTPEERLREIASIFAEGLRRLRRRRMHDGPSGAPASESSHNSLELSADSLPDGEAS